MQGLWIPEPLRSLCLQATKSIHSRGRLTSISFVSTFAVIWKALSLSQSFCETSHIRRSCWSKNKCSFLSTRHSHSFLFFCLLCSLCLFWNRVLTSHKQFLSGLALWDGLNGSGWASPREEDEVDSGGLFCSTDEGMWESVWATALLTLNISWQSSAFTSSHIMVLSSLPRASMDRS